jgi:hypothetical protein
MRTTIDLDAPVLRELKRLQKREGKSLGRLVSELVAEAMSGRTSRGSTDRPFRWISRPMGARVDLRDKEAVSRLLDAGTPVGGSSSSASSRP